jgi:hypothetical protein
MSLRWQWALVLAMSGSLVGACAQSLGEVARQQRNASEKPKAKRVITNEELGSAAPVEQSPGQPAPAAAAPRPIQYAGGDTNFAQREVWRARVSDARTKVARLEQEVRELQSEQIQRDRALFYGDAGLAAQDPMKSAEEQKKLVADLNKKRQELREARTDLDDALSRARVAGYSQ